MATGWAISDYLLWKQFSTWLDSLGSTETWYVDLYTNDRDPDPGDSVTDYELPDYDGYESEPIRAESWSAVQVVNHVAESSNIDACTWTVPEETEPIVVFGYLVRTFENRLLWAEAFESEQEVQPGASVTVVASLFHQNYPSG